MASIFASFGRLYSETLVALPYPWNGGVSSNIRLAHDLARQKLKGPERKARNATPSTKVGPE